MANPDFYAAITKFNTMYRLPSPERPTLLGAERIRNFQKILAEELAEADDLAARYEALAADGEPVATDRLSLLTELSDWLGDIIVYCASEARRWGLPLDDVLQVIMDSNFSKLGADGQPIYDDRGKVMKGPGYWRPEPKIQALLASRSAE